MKHFKILIFFLVVWSNASGQTIYQKDFDFYWNTINDNFAYFDIQKSNWHKVRDIYHPTADTITSHRTFIAFLEKVNNELYNGHVSLNANLKSSNKLVPTGADMWVVYQNKTLNVSSVRQGYNADKTGIKPGMRVVKFNDEPIEIAVERFMPKSIVTPDERMYEYAANMVLAGTHNGSRKITLNDNGEEMILNLDSQGKNEEDNVGLISSKMLANNIGYIRINNSLGNNDLIKVFDQALDSLWGTKGLIIDLRETPSGGNTTVARGIMSRFITKEMPYQKHSLPAEEKRFGVKRSWVELVTPRGNTYKKPLVVLANRWTGSMGEGMTIAFDGMKRARIVGDRMAGLLGAIYSFTMPETKLVFSFPVEKLFHVNGTPRENFIPQYFETDNDKQVAIALRLLKKGKSRS